MSGLYELNDKDPEFVIKLIENYAVLKTLAETMRAALNAWDQAKAQPCYCCGEGNVDDECTCTENAVAVIKAESNLREVLSEAWKVDLS